MTEQQKTSKTRIFAIANQKGGVGKTTTTVNLATALAACGKKILLIDMDPQGNASTGFGIMGGERGVGLYGALFGQASLVDVSRETKVPNLHLIPSTQDLSGAEIELLEVENHRHVLANLIKQADFQSYDYVFIDCPPSLGLLTLNALVAAHHVLVPLQAEFYALEGLSQLVQTINRVQENLNPTLSLYGIVLTMMDKRNNLAVQVEQDVRDYFGDRVFQTVIPRNVRVSEAPSFGLPAIIYDMKCAGSSAYLELAKEVLKREQNQKTEQKQEKAA